MLAFMFMLALPSVSTWASGLGQVTSLPVPRFASIKANRANVRYGPGFDYPVKFTLVRAGLPLEITAEFENWRRIRDWNGDEGWMLGTLLSGRRTALVRPWIAATPVRMFASPSKHAPLEAIVYPKVLVTIDECDGKWCEVTVRGETGYVRQAALWGAYPNEVF